MTNKIIKTGILIALLVIPVFVFLFLNFFGDNKYDIPYYFPKLNEAGHVVVNAEKDTVFLQRPDFMLKDQEGEMLSSSDLDGRPFVVNFFFTRCGLVCPSMNNNVARLLDRGKPGTFKIVSISIDPEMTRSLF